jgi:hypothetical protein
MLRLQCPSRIRHQLVLSLHRTTSPCIPEKFSFKSANSPFAERWRTADRKRPLPIPLRRFFSAEWYLSPSSAHKSAFLLYHFLVLTPCPSRHGWPCVVKPWWSPGAATWICQVVCTFNIRWCNYILSYFDLLQGILIHMCSYHMPLVELDRIMVISLVLRTHCSSART